MNDIKLLLSDLKKFLEDINDNLDEFFFFIKFDLNLMVDFLFFVFFFILNLIDVVNSGSEDVFKLIDNLLEKFFNL